MIRRLSQQGLEQVKQWKKENPHQVNKVPVESHVLNQPGAARIQSHTEHQGKGKQAAQEPPMKRRRRADGEASQKSRDIQTSSDEEVTRHRRRETDQESDSEISGSDCT